MMRGTAALETQQRNSPTGHGASMVGAGETISTQGATGRPRSFLPNLCHGPDRVWTSAPQLKQSLHHVRTGAGTSGGGRHASPDRAHTSATHAPEVHTDV